MNHDRWQQSRNLLCIRLDSLGDVLMTSPALRALRQSVDGRRITLLSSPAGAAIGMLIPEVDAVLEYEVPWMKSTRARSNASADRAMIERLRAMNFEAAVIFTVFSQSALPAALVCYLAEIPLRLAHSRENPYQLLTDWVVDPDWRDTPRHETQRQLDLVAAVGARTSDSRLSLAVPRQANQNIRKRLETHAIGPGRPWLVLHPGASAPSRRYACEQFATAATALMRDHGFCVVLSGDRHERALCDEINRSLAGGACNLAGELSLAEMVALVHAAPLLLCGNTGPVHIAAAVGTPVVDLYALTNPQHTPWHVAHRLLSYDVGCKYCYKSDCPEGHHECLRRIEPSQVVDAVLDLWVETQASDGWRAAVNSSEPKEIGCTR
jgi:lipopolysaccharide heptosyltransferase II